MLCSSCRKPIKPVVAVDIDGTLGDYHTHFLKFAEKWLGYKVPSWNYRGDENFGDWFCKMYGTDRTTYRQIKLAYRQGGLKRSMPEYPGMIEFVQGLHPQVEIWLTTTRPYLRLDTVDPDTRFWLDRHDVPYDGLLYDEAKYARLNEIVDPSRVIAIIDDLPEMYDAAEHLYGADVPILHTQAWNSSVWRDNQARADYLPDLIRKRIDAWKEIRSEIPS